MRRERVAAGAFFGHHGAVVHASAAGSISIGDLSVHRLGFGGMRLTGTGILGPPPDIASARATLRALPALGVNLVDTSNAYGPFISEALIRECLHPYAGLTIATKGGYLRPGPFLWHPDGRPASLRLAVQGSLKLLGVERIDLWQLHRIDPAVPESDQFGCIADLQREGLIRHVGLSGCTLDQLDLARTVFPVASVQHRYHVIDRRSESLVDRCAALSIPFIAYFPLATGALAAPDSILAGVASRLGITPAQAALAWLLHRSPSIVVIPGTQNPAHLAENVAAAAIRLSPDDFAEISRIGERAAKLRASPPT